MPNLSKQPRPKQKGFIQITLIIIGALVVLKYAYDIDVVGFLTEGKFRELLDKFYNLGSKGWEGYSEILLKLWNYFIDFIKSLIGKF